MTAVYPAGLPFFDLADAWERTGPQNAVIRTPMDKGPAKQRPLTMAAPKGWAGAIPSLTEAEVATFEDFFEVTLVNGTLEFTATDATTATTKTFRFIGTYLVRRRVPGRYRVSATLEILP